LNVARGASPSVSGWPEHNGGISMPRRVHLALGQKYFRFANSRVPREAQLSGGWWVEFETLNTIANFARQHATPREAARYLLGLPWEWTECDKLVSAILDQPLDAYRGKGSPARASAPTQPAAHPNDRGTAWIPPQHLEVMQLYIPGLADVCARAFPHPIVEDIWGSSYFKKK
jgi:hypothetical protein